MVANRHVSTIPPGKVMPLPYFTADIEGIGGTLKVQPEDFIVEEIPAYLPSGEGDHLYAWIQKSNTDTFSVIAGFAKALKLKTTDIGYAGMKDKRAVTRQYLSFPPGTSEDALKQVELFGVEVLETKNHANKLKTGHLKGNSFQIIVREIFGPEDALNRVENIFSQLRKPPGCPNYFGEQRFGRFGDNGDIGKQMVTETYEGRCPPKKRRLYISAYQSELFNRYVRDRISQLGTVLAGDILMKGANGPTFTCDDPSTDQSRLDAGELLITGPIFGHKAKLADGTPGEWEQEILAAEGIEQTAFKTVGKLAQGTRRPISIQIDDPTCEKTGADEVKIGFSLPRGCYATTVLREVMKVEAQ